MSGLPIAQYPEVVPPMVQITTTFVGASATDVEASVATPRGTRLATIEMKINYLEPVEKGTIVAEARVLRKGRTTAVAASRPSPTPCRSASGSRARR